MRITHHRLIGLNTLMVIEMIKQKDLPIPENINLDKDFGCIRTTAKR